MVRMSTAFPVVPWLGPGQHSLDSILPGQPATWCPFLSWGWGVGGWEAGSKDILGFLSSVLLRGVGGYQLGQCHPHLSLGLTVMTVLGLGIEVEAPSLSPSFPSCSQA